ncbi:MAG: DUF5060 domain-containing protein [Bacteroidota bacterium]
MRVILFILFSTILLITSCVDQKPVAILEVSQWEKITLSVIGPNVSEQDSPNPFTDYRVTARFAHQDEIIEVPGYYAADGNAAETSASSGGTWQVRFRPNRIGKWTYTIEMRNGDNIAVSNDPESGTIVNITNSSGTIMVSAPKADEKGRLTKDERNYLHWSETGEAFIKGGADSPENLLGYADFDDTYYYPEEKSTRPGEDTQRLHIYEPHLQDWSPGDPTWQNGKGKGLIGGLNYLASSGVNSIYFLTMNINGDGKDVWPYTSPTERLRFDCSKLDQWEIVFDHMDELGIMLHIVLQETENETLLDDGNTDLERKIYLRELVARFAHHKAVTWNLGEENGPNDWSDDAQSVDQVKAMSKYLDDMDPYNNLIVIHTHPGRDERRSRLQQLLRDPHIDGVSLQLGDRRETYEVTGHWVRESRTTGKSPWIVTIDEIGPHTRGVDPDDRPDNNQDSVRADVLWANLMAYGAGVEWYFGYKNHNADLQCEDWRSRHRVWEWTNHAITFFHDHVDLDRMERFSQLLPIDLGYAIDAGNNTYVVYFKATGDPQLNLSSLDGEYVVEWFDPRNGG